MLGNPYEQSREQRHTHLPLAEQAVLLNTTREEEYLEDFLTVPAPLAGTPLNASIAQEPGVERSPAGAPEPCIPPTTARGLAGTPDDL